MILHILTILLAFGPPGPPGPPGPRHTGRILFKMRGDAIHSVMTVKAPLAAVVALSALPGVEYVEEDMEVPPEGGRYLPNDPQLAQEWHIAKVGAPSAWDTAQGAGVTIAIADTGCDPTHPDLASSYVPGWNFYDGNSDTRDVYGHGTATAGAACGIGGNGIGGCGVAFQSRILPERISGLDGYATYGRGASAIRYAADHGARVVNLSYQMSESLTVQDAAAYARSKGCVTVISAGNTGATSTLANPSQVVTVGATERDDSLASFSVRGSIVDVYAPGRDILTTTRGGGYGWWWGTSFSAPIVAGEAALVLAAHPEYSATDAIVAVQGSCDLTAGGIKRVNASRAVSVVVMHVADPSYGGGGGGKGHGKR